MRKTKAFTLVELLIVILIIGILAAILIIALTGRILPEKIKTTSKRMEIIVEALQRFTKDFPVRKNPTAGSGRGMPRQSEFADITVDGVAVPNMTGGEFLRLILFPNEAEIAMLKSHGITHAVAKHDEIKEMLNSKETEDENGRLIPPNKAFVDMWNKPFYYRFPGLNHSDKGPYPQNHKDAKGQFGANHLAANAIPDIWSAGPNGVNDEANWATSPNDPFGLSDSNDDICNWFDNEG